MPRRGSFGPRALIAESRSVSVLRASRPACLICVLAAARLRRGAHAGLVDEALGGGVDRPAGAATRRMNIERAAAGRLDRDAARRGGRLQWDLVLDRRLMVGEQHIRAVDAVQLEQALDEIGLAAQQQ